MDDFTLAELAEIAAHLEKMGRTQDRVLSDLRQLRQALQQHADEGGQRQFKRREPQVTKSLASRASFGLLDGYRAAERQGALADWLDAGRLLQKAGEDLFRQWAERHCKTAAA